MSTLVFEPRPKPLRRQARLLRTMHELHGSDCPCCGHTMVKATNARPHPPNVATKGHDYSRKHNTGGLYRLFVRICHRCNSEQSHLSYEEWADKLEREGDYRASRVRKVASMVRLFT